MLNAGAAVMGSAETSGEDRALRAAQQALASPLLDNKDIMGAKRILLSIISGEEAELQMDELSQITEYIQEQSGEECEVIFGHGVDAALGNCIRVTVIATGFAGEGKVVAKKVVTKTVHDLEKSNSISAVMHDNSVNERNDEIELKISDEMNFVEPAKDEPFFDFDEEIIVTKEPEPTPVPVVRKAEEKPVYKKEEKPSKKEETPLEERSYTLSLFDDNDIVAKKYNDSNEDDEDDDISKFRGDDDEFEIGKEVSADQVINEDGMMDVRKTKQRLEQQAKERRERFEGCQET